MSIATNHSNEVICPILRATWTIGNYRVHGVTDMEQWFCNSGSWEFVDIMIKI